MVGDHLFKKKTEFKETGDSNYTYQKKLDKACFQHDMAYGDFKIYLKEPEAIKF